MIRKALGSIFCSYASYRYHKLRKSYSDPIRLQKKNLKNILNKSRYTAIGRHFDFKTLRSISDYQKRVPLVRYEQMKPWVDECLKGKVNHIWPGKIRYFALTSGTTSGTSKYIPVSGETIKNNKKAGLDCLLFYLVNTKGKSLLEGKMLFLGGSTSLQTLTGGLQAGDMSGIMSRFIPFYVLNFYEPGRRLALVPNWEEKIKRIIEKIKDKDIRLVSGVPSWLLMFLEHLLNTKKKKKICEIWPNLSLFIYGGMDFSPYEKLIQDVIGKNIYYMETYFASEALIGIQDTPCAPGRGINDKGLLLMLDYGIFYEFVKLEDIKNENPKRYTVSEVETDVTYAIVVTNTSGLYSYIMGDTIKFVSKHPLRIKVIGRIEDFLSAFGEHIITEEVEYAISQASSQTEALIQNYTVAPYYPENKTRPPGHQWLIEFLRKPADLDKFTKIIDETLCLRNDDYKAHREGDFGMSGPSIYELKEGIFYKWHKKMGKLGGQHKTPRLRNDRTIAEELIRLNQEETLE